MVSIQGLIHALVGAGHLQAGTDLPLPLGAFHTLDSIGPANSVVLQQQHTRHTSKRCRLFAHSLAAARPNLRSQLSSSSTPLWRRHATPATPLLSGPHPPPLHPLLAVRRGHDCAEAGAAHHTNTTDALANLCPPTKTDWTQMCFEAQVRAASSRVGGGTPQQ